MQAAPPLAIGLGLRPLSSGRGASRRRAAGSVQGQAVEDVGTGLCRWPSPSRDPRAGACGGSARCRRQQRGAPSTVMVPLGEELSRRWRARRARLSPAVRQVAATRQLGSAGGRCLREGGRSQARRVAPRRAPPRAARGGRRRRLVLTQGWRVARRTRLEPRMSAGGATSPGQGASERHEAPGVRARAAGAWLELGCARVSPG